ncbi:MAG: hypothetical protein KQH63_15415 [Desulfobulbaceae bacterium]|nr:hypothetical protein [Desulfobulbaceae bacterium]
MEASSAWDKETRIEFIIFLAAILGCILFAQNAWGSYRQFIPKYLDFSAEMGVNSLYEWNKNESDSSSSTRSDLTLFEGMKVTGLGYIYSPLFVSLKTVVGLGLIQERIERDGETYTARGDGHSFLQEAKILPTHPYNLDLFFQRAIPITAGQEGESGTVVIYSYGADARYEKRPWATTLTYTGRKREAVTTAETNSLLYNFHYFHSGASFSGLFHHSEGFRDDGNDTTERDMYSLSLLKELEKIRFSSRWTHDQEDEDNTGGVNYFSSNIESDEFTGEVSFDLPYKFKSHISYINLDRRTNTSLNDRSQQSYSKSENYNFRLSHRLYESLQSAIQAGYNTIDSVSGQTNLDNYRLTLDYTKKIPWGSVSLGFSNSLSLLDNTGAPLTIAPQTIAQSATSVATKFGPAFLININDQTVDESTILVRASDPEFPGRQIFLTRGIDYEYDDVDKILYILDTGITPPGLDPDTDYPRGYSFTLEYSSIWAEYELQTDAWGTTLQLPLFDNLITPHYSYMQSDQKVTSGNYPGEPANSKIHSIGLSLIKVPFKADISRSWLRSNTNSEDRLLFSTSYSKAITPFTTGFLSFSFEDSQTEQHETGTTEEQTTNLSEQIYNFQAQIQTIIPEKNITASLTSNYSLYMGTGETTNFSLYSTLIWHVGKLDVDLSATYSTTDSKVADSETQRQNALVKLMIRRELF